MLNNIAQRIDVQKLQQLPKVLNVLLVILIAYILAELTWQLTPGKLLDETTLTLSQVPPRPESATPKNNIAQVADSLASLSIFGQATADALGKDAALNAPITQLNLRLVGILATIGEYGLAMIASGNEEEKLYKIGDKVMGVATLKQVMLNQVVLETPQGLEVLKLPVERAEGFSFAPTLAPPPPGYSQPPRIAPVSQSPPITQRLENYRKRFIRDPASLAEVADVQPVNAEGNGAFIGFRLNPKTDNDFFAQVGLRPGDVITQINGVKLDQPAKGFGAMRKLMSAQELNITVLRGGQEVVIKQEFGR